MNVFKSITGANKYEYKVFLEDPQASDLVDPNLTLNSNRKTNWDIFSFDNLKDISVGDTIYLIDYYGEDAIHHKPVVVKNIDAARKIFDNTCRWKYEIAKKNDKNVHNIHKNQLENEIAFGDERIGIKIIEVIVH